MPFERIKSRKQKKETIRVYDDIATINQGFSERNLDPSQGRELDLASSSRDDRLWVTMRPDGVYFMGHVKNEQYRTGAAAFKEFFGQDTPYDLVATGRRKRYDGYLYVEVKRTDAPGESASVPSVGEGERPRAI